MTTKSSANEFIRGLNDLSDELHKESPDDYFPGDETERRMKETMNRMFGRPPSMNLRTGQNLSPPFIDAAELKRLGYPCDNGLE